MAAAGASGGAGGIEQHGIERLLRLPLQGIGLDQRGGEASAGEVFLHALEPLGPGIKRSHLPASRGQLHRLTARRGAEIEHAATFASTEQPGGQAGGQVLHPPGAVLETLQPFNRDPARKADMAAHQAGSVQPFGPFTSLGRIPQRQIERWRNGKADGHRSTMFTPTGADTIRQARHRRQCRFALDQRGEDPVRQPPRATCQQRQAGGDHRVRRRFQPQPARQHQPQGRTRFGVFGQDLPRRAIDQGVKINQPAQHLARQCPGQRPIRITAHPLQGGLRRLIERFTAPQDCIEKLERSLARREARNIHCPCP